MNKKAFFVLILMLALVLSMPNAHAQQQGAQSPGPWYCPWMGGPMQQGSGMGCCMVGRPASSTAGRPLTREQARELLEDYAGQGSNPDLKVGEITDQGSVYEAVIVTRDGSHTQKIQVDKSTGWFRNIS